MGAGVHSSMVLVRVGKLEDCWNSQKSSLQNTQVYLELLSDQFVCGLILEHMGVSELVSEEFELR